jgi:ApbE superfamily uncharacterized protein (UPF0280 family)
MAAGGLVGFEVVHGETDLHISARRDLSAEAAAIVAELRAQLEGYVGSHPRFAESFVPVEVEHGSPEIVRAMAEAGRVADVGPFAAVAGAVAERVARALQPLSSEVIVENGGDLYLIGREPRRVLVLAGDSPLSGKVAIALHAGDAPVAVCTSSGKVGHSVSLGVADAVCIVAADGALADAVATTAGNLVQGPEDIPQALERAMSIRGVIGAVIIVDDALGALGRIELVPVA